MDLQLYAIIAIVFFASFVSLLFINKTRGGKSFEDVLAEKRQLAHIIGGSKYQKKSQQARKLNNNHTKKDKKERKQKERREQQEIEESQNDSDAGSDSQSASSNSPAHSKGHVEFSETEIIPDEPVTIGQSKKNLKKSQNRKNSATKPILVNKIETPVVSPSATAVSGIETVNHFEQIQPKDDVEIKRKKNQNKTKNSPNTEKSLAVVETVAEPIAVVEKVIQVAVEPVATQRDSPKNAKLNKKKKNENIAAQQQHLNHESRISSSDDTNIHSIMYLLGRADLARSEIQIVIDYLLNKQQDTLVDHSNWSDDPLQKVQKQLLEREQALAEEQEAAASLHAKLREMRAQINTLSAQNKSYETVHQKLQDDRNNELQLLSNEFKLTKERLEQDNGRLEQAVKHLQEELFKKQQALASESSQKLQQLSEANASLNQETQRLQQSLLQLQADSSAKIGEYEQKIQEIQELHQLSRQQESIAQMGYAQKDKEFAEMFSQAGYDLEQMKSKLDQQLAESKQLDDKSKVEIRNLQNALDSSNREVSVFAGEASKWRQLHTDMQLANSADQTRLGQQSQEVEKLVATVVEVKALLADKEKTIAQNQAQIKVQNDSIAQLQSQISQFNHQKALATHELNNSATEAESRFQQQTSKVSELSSKLIENESAIAQHTTHQQQQDQRIADLQAEINLYKDKNNQAKQHIAQSLNRTKLVFERLFPTTGVSSDSDYDQWLDQVAAHIEQQQREHASMNSNSVNHKSSKPAQMSAATITNHVNHKSNSTQSSGSLPAEQHLGNDLILENAKLQATVEQYKTIVADTDKVLNWLEAKVREQELQLATTNGNVV